MPYWSHQRVTKTRDSWESNRIQVTQMRVQCLNISDSNKSWSQIFSRPQYDMNYSTEVRKQM